MQLVVESGANLIGLGLLQLGNQAGLYVLKLGLARLPVPVQSDHDVGLINLQKARFLASFS